MNKKFKLTTLDYVLIGISIVSILFFIMAVTGVIGEHNLYYEKQSLLAELSKLQSEASKDSNSKDISPETYDQYYDEELSLGDNVDNLTIGSNVTLDGIDFKLDKVSFTEGPDYLEPSENSIYLVAEFTITNNSSQTYETWEADFSAFADNFSVPMAFFGDKTIFDINDLPPGKYGTGTVAFEVPKNSSNYEIIVEPDYSSSSSATFTFTVSH